MKLRTHLLLLTLLTLLPVLVFSAAMIVVFYRQERAAQERQLVDRAHAVSLVVDRELLASLRALQALAASSHLVDGNLKEFYEQATRVWKTQASWNTVVLFDARLRQMINLQRPYGAQLPSTPPEIPEIKETIERKQPLISNLFAGRVGGTRRVAVTQPVVIDGRVAYVLGASIALEFLSEILAEQKFPVGWIATIIDRNKNIVARTQNLDKFLGQPATPLFATKSSEAESGFFYGVTREGIAVATGYRRSDFSGWTVGVAIPVSLLEAPARRSLGYLGAGALIFLLASLGVSAFLGERLAASVAAVANAAKTLINGDADAPRPALGTAPVPIAEANDVVRALEEIAARRKEAEQALRQERDFATAALDSLPGVFYCYDDSLRFRRWNKNLERVTGYGTSEIAGMSPLDFFSGADRELIRERIREVFTRGWADAEADLVAKDGTRMPYYFTGSIVEIEGKPHLVGVGIDITVKKRAEDALRSARDELEKKVAERTADLRKMVNLMAGREVRMAELKEIIRRLDAQLKAAGIEPAERDPLANNDKA